MASPKRKPGGNGQASPSEKPSAPAPEPPAKPTTTRAAPDPARQSRARRRRSLSEQIARLHRYLRISEFKNTDIPEATLTDMERRLAPIMQQVTGASRRDQALVWLADATAQWSVDLWEPAMQEEVTHAAWLVHHFGETFFAQYPEFEGSIDSKLLYDHLRSHARSLKRGKRRKNESPMRTKWETFHALVVAAGMVDPEMDPEELERVVRRARNRVFPARKANAKKTAGNAKAADPVKAASTGNETEQAKTLRGPKPARGRQKQGSKKTRKKAKFLRK